MTTPQHRKDARLLMKEPSRPVDFAAWEPNPDNLLECYTYRWLPHNMQFFSAYEHTIFKEIANGSAFALSLSIIDTVRHMPIQYRDVHGNIATKMPKASHTVSPYMARLVKLRCPEMPIGYAEEFPNGRPFLTLRPTAKPCSDWLEGK